MAFVALFVSATKLAGILVTVTVTANAFSFSGYRRKNLRPFWSPIDESSDTPAVFNVDPASEEENKFFFGLATAPAHVEDRLNDAWLQFAEEKPCDKLEPLQNLQPADASMASATGDGGSQQVSLSVKESERTTKRKKLLKIAMEAMIRGLEKYSEEEEPVPSTECSHNIAAWHNVPHPEERLKFWSDPDTEVKLAKDSGELRNLFCFCIWVSSIIQQMSGDAQRGRRLEMLSEERDWRRFSGNMVREIKSGFCFCRLVVDSVSDLVDYWVTFNEPHVFCMLTYCAGVWSGGNPDMLEVATSALPTGVFKQAMHWMAIAHSKAYDYIHEHSTSSKATVGVAHHVSFMRPYGLFDVAAISLANSLTLFPYVDSISDRLDFIGINYYGQEVVSGAGLKLVETEEYSESGCGVYPDGLYRMLLQFHERYKHLKVPFIITENGISDETDLIRRPYMVLTCPWVIRVFPCLVTCSGLFLIIGSGLMRYGPKFGLVAVDRANGLARIPRPSYYLFSNVVTTGKITRQDRVRAWNELQRAAKEQKTRLFYQAVNKHGLMYAGGLDKPIWRHFIQQDWRFGHYEMDGLQDPLSRLSRYILEPFSFKRKEKPQMDDELVFQPLE
ncbi:hypothetical protein HHK36_023092 [Tetracentron sinense]|uniref:Uncharacterized protein n=1 Tax=Tetracentron sinense TaxID=13715 RepID=A0A835D6X7_TETSI|nr:hypothetical protein HHK36_023092 [Tetracentron sinense]